MGTEGLPDQGVSSEGEVLKRRLGTLALLRRLFSGMSSCMLRPQPSLSAQRTLSLAHSSETVRHPASSARVTVPEQVGMLLWPPLGILSEESFSDRTTGTGSGLVVARELEEEKSGVTVFPDGPAGKESGCREGDAGDTGSIPGLGRSPGDGRGNPLQYCLENPTDRGAWPATVQRVTKSRTRLSDYSVYTHTQ